MHRRLLRNENYLSIASHERLSLVSLTHDFARKAVVSTVLFEEGLEILRLI